MAWGIIFDIEWSDQQIEDMGDEAALLQNELLYARLVEKGHLWALGTHIDGGLLGAELEKFSTDWHVYNPRRKNMGRWGLSLTSLDGAMTGVPDLDSLAQYNHENGTQYDEHHFTHPTRVLRESTALSELKSYLPHLGRSHLLKIEKGGFFPYHRDSHKWGSTCLRLIALLDNAGPEQFVFLFDNKRIFMEPGRLYFMNTRIEHGLISFVPDATLLVLNVILSTESVQLLLASKKEI